MPRNDISQKRNVFSRIDLCRNLRFGRSEMSVSITIEGRHLTGRTARQGLLRLWSAAIHRRFPFHGKSFVWRKKSGADTPQFGTRQVNRLAKDCRYGTM
jgi:hypothetical protein